MLQYLRVGAHIFWFFYYARGKTRDNSNFQKPQKNQTDNGIRKQVKSIFKVDLKYKTL